MPYARLCCLQLISPSVEPSLLLSNSNILSCSFPRVHLIFSSSSSSLPLSRFLPFFLTIRRPFHDCLFTLDTLYILSFVCSFPFNILLVVSKPTYVHMLTFPEGILLLILDIWSLLLRRMCSGDDCSQQPQQLYDHMLRTIAISVQAACMLIVLLLIFLVFRYRKYKVLYLSLIRKCHNLATYYACG